MKRFIFTLTIAVLYCTIVSAQLTSAQKKAKVEIFNALITTATNVVDYDERTISFEYGSNRYFVDIVPKNYAPLYITIMLAFNLPEEYDTDIARTAAIKAAEGMPVYVDCSDGLLVFDCEMYVKDAKPFIAVLPNMIKALHTSGKNFDSAYEEAKKKVVLPTEEKNSVNTSASSKEKSDNNIYIFPQVASNEDSDHLCLTKVTLDSQYTILDMTSYNRGEYQWCSISRNSYLSVNGTKYTLKKAEGIAYSPQHTDFPNYESGGDVSLSFKLYFPALPSRITKFDFSEGTQEGWQLKGIELQHGKSYAIKGELLETTYQKWNCTAIEIQDGQTIVTKVCIPKENGTYMYSSQEEYIEDADTGRKYYLINSSIGFEGSPIISYDTTPITFYEVYPALPFDVKRINIWSGTQYYVKNLEIR